MGENVVHISGVVSGDCQLNLKTERASKLDFINTRKVSGKFIEVFSISAENYTVVVKCNNLFVLSRDVSYPSELNKFNLGQIN